MEKNILFMRRIQYLIDRMKKEDLHDFRKKTYVGLKAIILELNELNQGNVHLHEQSFELLENLKWLAHIDDPGYEDQVYIEEIDKSLRELHSGSGIVFAPDHKMKFKEQASL